MPTLTDLNITDYTIISCCRVFLYLLKNINFSIVGCRTIFSKSFFLSVPVIARWWVHVFYLCMCWCCSLYQALCANHRLFLKWRQYHVKKLFINEAVLGEENIKLSIVLCGFTDERKQFISQKPSDVVYENWNSLFVWYT